MSAAARPRFPDVVWDAAILRPLDARGRAEVEAAGRIVSAAANGVFFHAGEAADAIYVVVDGQVALTSTRRGEEHASATRRVSAGGVFGEEATASRFAKRRGDARVTSPVATVAEVPLVVLRRAAMRAGAADALERVERSLRRTATFDFLRTASFTQSLGERELEALVDAATHRELEAGDALYREREAPLAAFFVAEGLLRAESDDDGRPRVEGYLAPGDLVGEEELEGHDLRRVSVVASGPSAVIAVPRDAFLAVARRHPGRVAAASRLRTTAKVPANATTTVFKDVYRLRVARSLLVIDQEGCLRCGHCVVACADAHVDGIARLVRHGDKIVRGAGVPPLLVPNSCQHCRHPSCMTECPTGAIGRDARGEVFIREDLCTGCGNCAKACPWDNIQMAPRGSGSADVAVKCDLCKGKDGGPACVAACPVSAIARIDPNVELGEVVPKPARGWPWAAFGGFAGLALVVSRPAALSSGVILGIAILLLAAYAAAKRVAGPVGRFRARARLARPLFVGHVSLGTFALFAILAHTHFTLPNDAAGALTLALFAVVATGAFGGVVGLLVPRRLSRLERKSVLPEEIAAREKEIHDAIFAALSGKSELVKTVFAKAVRPYLRAPVMFLVLAGRTRSEERRRLGETVNLLLGGRRSERTRGLDELVDLAIDARAVRAERWLTMLLRGWQGPHVAATAAAIVLLVLHVASVVRAR